MQNATGLHHGPSYLSSGIVKSKWWEEEGPQIGRICPGSVILTTAIPSLALETSTTICPRDWDHI